MLSFALYMTVLIFAVVIAGAGMDFSPSFTVMFLVLFLVLTAAGEFFAYFREKRYGCVLILLGQMLSVTGAALVMASVFIYAAGDDWLWKDIPISLVASLILHLALYVLLYRKQGRKMGIGAGMENCALLAAGLFTLACAVSSTALWPYGLGVLLILTARRLGSAGADIRLSRGTMAAGMLLCSVFPAAPMVF